MEAITIQENEKFLRQKSQEVVFPDQELSKDIEVVKDYLRTHDGCFAMASIQLGIPKKILIIKSTSSDLKPNEEKDWIIIINPTIISQHGKTEFWEACWSGMLNFALVERPYKIDLKFYDVDGNVHREEFEGFVSTVLSHELDHLDGIFHMDRAKQLMQMEISGRMPWRQKHPYKIFSKDCDFEYATLQNDERTF